MGETFQLVLNLPVVLKSLDDLVYKQIPFATAAALTETARRASEAVKRRLPERFTIRNTWVQRGVRFTPADKRDWPHCQAAVHDKDLFMTRQEEGGDKTPIHGRSLARPVDIRVAPQTVLSPGKWPKALLKRKGYFLQKLPNGKTGLFRRAGKARYPVQLLYVFESRVHVKPRWGFAHIVEDSVNHLWERNFAEALEKATATAR